MAKDFEIDDDSEVVIGRGTWIDKLALDVIERKDSIQGDTSAVIRTESGLGASGFPHIGSFADASRAYVFKLALEDMGRDAEFIAFADSMDGLRKVPIGTPTSLKEHLGKPVSIIPDPWECHQSYGEHMSSLLMESLDAAGIEYTPVSAFDLYSTGKLVDQVRMVLLQAQLAGRIIHETTGQEKYLTTLPYHAICENCQKIYTTRAISFDEKRNLVEYLCEGDDIGGKALGGCNHHGFSDISKGEGKLTWKVEFAARWHFLHIDFEAFGKDIFESVICNDRVSKEIFNYEPPTHARYEVFLDDEGRKISKSKGNVIEPKTWFKYGSSQSLALLTYKRMTGSRRLTVKDIPIYMKELDDLEDIYFGITKESNPSRMRKLKGLYEYCLYLRPPKEAPIHIPYSLLVNLVSVAPDVNRDEFLDSRLREYGYLQEGNELNDIIDRVEYAENWVADFEQIEGTKIDLSPSERTAIEGLINCLKSGMTADEIQTAIFETSRESNIKPNSFFKLLYQLLLNDIKGPRLGPYIHTIGVDVISRALRARLS
ncbi:MAG: lysine--tRNA ligase [Candidatus Thorarchaeota archaeon]